MSAIFLQGAQPVMAFETLAVSTVAVPLTATVYETFESTNNTRQQAKLATISIASNDIRVRFDGTAPTSSVGHLLPAGTFLELQSITQIRNFKMIRVSADAVATITYFGS